MDRMAADHVVYAVLAVKADQRCKEVKRPGFSGPRRFAALTRVGHEVCPWLRGRAPA